MIKAEEPALLVLKTERNNKSGSLMDEFLASQKTHIFNVAKILAILT